MKIWLQFTILFSWLCLMGIYPDALGQTKDSNATFKVIVFLDPECPISQSYMPLLRELSQTYRSKNVLFESVFPAYTVTDAEISEFLSKYDAPFSGSTDKGLVKTKRYHAKVMPEVVLLDQNDMVVYQGAIDNWYVELGKNRPKPTEFYLRDAIEASLNGNPLVTRRTHAVGCLIND